MTIAWIVTTDGRQTFLERSLPTWDGLGGTFTHRAILDDSGDAAYREWVSGQYPQWEVIPVGETRQGYSAAMRKIREVGLDSGADYIFHLEDDFILNSDINMNDLAGVLEERPYLGQIALRRQPWFSNEVDCGGVIEALEVQGQHFTEVSNGKHNWIEHRAVWTANPNIFSRDVAKIQYPDSRWSESVFMRSLISDPKLRNAYWGKRSDDYYVLHIGEYRNGIEY